MQDQYGLFLQAKPEERVEVLGTLTEREQKVLRLRFGLDDGRARTLEEVGKEFNVNKGAYPSDRGESPEKTEASFEE